MMTLSWLMVLNMAVSACQGYHILSIQGGLSKSHYNLMIALNKILLEAGHEVTFITTYPDTKPTKNLHKIDVSEVLEINKYINVTDHHNMGIDVVKIFGKNISEAIIATPAVQQALINTQFDAVVSEWFISDLDAGYSAVQQIPRIVLCGTMMHSHIQHLVDIARDLLTTPVMWTNVLPPMSFVERILNNIAHYQLSWMNYFETKSSYERYFRPIAEARNVSLPPFHEARYDIAVVLVNSHPTYAPTHSLPPNAVEVGGYHVDAEVPALPNDLQDILDSSPQGVIYFSMGTNVKSNGLPANTIKELIQVFERLPLTVLWKFEDSVPNPPQNLHVRPWIPQTSILAHRNVKAFITHSGLLSTIEAVRFGVPQVSIPVFADQPVNSISSVRAGYAIQVKFSPNMAPELEKALKEIISNDTYFKQAKKMSKFFHRRPVDPKKLILHYIELAIESQGANYLRLSHDLAWYQVWMLDQAAFFIFIFYLIYKLIVTIFRLIVTRQSKIKVKQYYTVFLFI